MINIRNHRYHEMKSHLVSTSSRRCCVTHLSTTAIHPGFTLLDTCEDRVATMELTLTKYAPPFSIITHSSASTPLIHAQASGPSSTIIEIDEVHGIAYPSFQWVSNRCGKCGLSPMEHRNRHLDTTSRVDTAAQWQSCCRIEGMG